MEVWDEEEEELDNPQHFQVNVIVLEARHLSMIQSDCQVVVTIGNSKKTLRSKTARSDAPYFNEFCIFNFYQPLSALLDEILEIKLYGVQKVLRNRLIGGFNVELSTVWLQPNHQFYHKWATLTDENNPAEGVKGYLKCDIGILAQGTKWKQKETDQADNIEDHLLVPYGEVNDRQRAKFIFSVFRADNFSDEVAAQPLGLYAYVRIRYGGKSCRTSVARNTFEPFWNEELTFDDMVPAMCQYVHIELCDAFKTTANGILGTANLDLRKLSHESEKGFLPTYGPSFLYLYQNFGKLDQHSRCPYVSCSFTYMCRLLMALRTEVVDYAEDVLVKKTDLAIKPKSITSIKEEKYFKYNEFIFFAVVFDILLFDPSIVSSKVSVRVNIGPDKPISDEQILIPVQDGKSALVKQPAGEDTGDAGSIRSKKTVTFEGDDVTEISSEVPVLQEVREKTPTQRVETRRKLFLRQLMYWPTKWPENNKWGRALNERLERREETKFKKWTKRRKRRLQSWPMDWKRKRKEVTTSESGTETKRARFEQPSGEMIRVEESQGNSSSSLENIYFDASESFDNNEVNKMINSHSTSVSSISTTVGLFRIKEETDLLRQEEYQDGGESTEGEEESKPVRSARGYNNGYWPMKMLVSWAKDFRERENRRSTAKSLIEEWKSRKRKRKLQSDSETSESLDEETEGLVAQPRKPNGLNTLKAWPTYWRWQRRKNKGKITRDHIEESKSDMSTDPSKAKPRKRTTFQGGYGKKLGLRKEEPVTEKYEEKTIKAPQNTVKTDTVKTVSSQKSSYTSYTLQSVRKTNPEIKTAKESSSQNVVEEVSPSAMVPPLVVPPTTEEDTTSPTSGNELPEVTDSNNSDVSLPHRRQTISDSGLSLLSQKTIWPRDLPPLESEESSDFVQEKPLEEKERLRGEQNRVSGRSSEVSEEIAKTNYSDFESRSGEDSPESPKSRRRDIYKNLEHEEEIDETEATSESGLTEWDRELNEVTSRKKLKPQQMQLEEDVQQREIGTKMANTEEEFSSRENEYEESMESAKTKKRYWYSKTPTEEKTSSSSDSRTDANDQPYKSLNEMGDSNESFDSDWEDEGVSEKGSKGKLQQWQGSPVQDGDRSKDFAEDSKTSLKSSKREEWTMEEDDEEGVVENEEEKRPEKKSKENVTWEDETDIEVHTEESRHIRVYNGCNSTDPQPITIRQHYGFTTFSGRYPCLHINGEWPNALRRMYRSNVIQQSVVRFTMGINDVINELSSENKMEASEKLKKVFSEVSAKCREILNLTAKIEPEDTNLYRERKRYYHREIKEIIAKMENASKKKVLIAENELDRAYGYLSTLKRYAEDPEDSFPDTEIWLIKDGKSVAQNRMRTRKLVFSLNISERGVRSGKIQSVIVRGKDGNVVAKLEMFMWFGLGSHFFECRNMLPPGFANEVHQCPGTTVANVPLLLTYAEVHNFQCRVHLLQARITAGADVSGLADPFVRVTILDQQKESQTEKETLNPAWDETLVFSKLMIYGPADYIKVNPVTVTVEVMDYDYLSRSELIGRALLKPVVKLSSEDYAPPQLVWEEMRRDCSETGKILLAVELLEVSGDEPNDLETDGNVVRIPKEIRPKSVGYRLEVLFWGVRELRKKATGSTRVFVTLECAGKHLKSPVLKNAMKNPNFPGTVQTLRLNLPEEHEFMPPLIMKLYQTSSFAMTYETYSGNCMIPSVKVFFCETVDDEERKRKETAFLELLKESNRKKQEEELEKKSEEEAKKRKFRWKRLKTKAMNAMETVGAAAVGLYNQVKCKLGKSCATTDVDDLPALLEDEGLDWWAKYYASKESDVNAADVEKLVVYEEELEVQPEFHGFSDFIYTFNMVMGKVKNEVQRSILTGKVKAAIKLYRWPLENNNSHTLYGVDIRKGLLEQLPSNEAIKYVARVYVISCKNLTPKDVYGKSDPYLYLQVGNQKINDAKNYIPKQVNPIFGKCFEFRGIFPQQHLLTVKVMDHDMLGDDDLIGETSIDLESRYYTKYHASCGIPQVYATAGYSAWRDVSRPTEILKVVCKQSNMPEPIYSEKSVRIGDYEFAADEKNERHRAEAQALAALKKWQEIPLRGFKIVPEHIETRGLYHPSFPGVEQGKIEMWVDIFPADFRYVPPIVDIKPREPVSMELRAIVWNVEDVTLDDKSLVFNEKMSDIYVQGWLAALEEDKQVTDVHYRSMNGEGNFNWRFIFPFKYITSERRLVVYKKMTAFDLEPEELKFPCRLELQVWDNDFLSDDFLGSLNLELGAMPRGAKLSTRCKLSMFEESPKIDLFKIRRTRGWWPFKKVVDAESSEYRLTGKIDLELEIVTEKEAADYPVGKGREEPRALPQPKRPESSFIWALNPLKTFRYVICRKYGKYLITVVLVAMLVAFILIGIYAFPGYAVKRLVGA